VLKTQICVTRPQCVNICKAQWSLHVPSSGQYIYRPVVTICTAQWSLYIPHSGHYMYGPVVTIYTAHWSLYVPPSGHYMYRTVVTICTTSLTFNNSTFYPHTVFKCFVWISEQTAIISLNSINWLVFISETDCVYCAVRAGYLYIILISSDLKRLKKCSNNFLYTYKVASQCVVHFHTSKYKTPLAPLLHISRQFVRLSSQFTPMLN
jgi:hypothetical protein